MASETRVSEVNPLTFTLETDFYLLAVYEEHLGPRLTYETGFEDATKQAYAVGLIETNEYAFVLNEALIGSLASDLRTGAKSIRIRNGYVETDFGVSGIDQVQFAYGRYLSDVASEVLVSVSNDRVTWIQIGDPVMTSEVLQTFSFSFSDDWFIANSLAREDDLYIRITSANDLRVNIDDFKIWRDAYQELPLISIFADDTDTSFPNNSSRVEIIFKEDFKQVLAYNESWDLGLCEAVDSELGSSQCLVYGNVDTTRLGYHEVIYYFLDADGNYASESVTHVVLKDPSLLEVDYIGYYDGIEGLYGEDLLIALREIINEGIYRRSYDEARQILGEADVAPTDNTQVLTIYTRQLVPLVWNPDIWNREHVWPNSRLGVPSVSGSDRNIASDLHNLRAIIPGVNSSRSNKVFAWETTSSTYDPGPDRGEVSRIMFYMVVMYDYLELVDRVLPNDPETNYTLAGAKMSLISAFLSWHYEDPVDQFELDRN